MIELSLGKPRECDKGCGEIIAWDNTERDGRGGFIEINGNNQFHSKTRCESLGGVWPALQGQQQQQTTKPKEEIKQAVNQDINYAILQKLEECRKLLAKIAGVEE